MDIAAANPILSTAAQAVVLPVQAISPLVPTDSPIRVRLITAPVATSSSAKTRADTQAEAGSRRPLERAARDEAAPARQAEAPRSRLAGGLDVYA